MIKRAFEILDTGGLLVYSTCTFAPEENEGIIDFLLNKFDNAVTEEININIKHAPGITSWNCVKFKHDVKKCMRIYPHHNKTGGLFIAKITKTP